ncbi:MAG TPA: tRNA (adenosine(37)-N6)-threonylcarbamoyltransferase complex dimerization subunit type 1 TsaB [Candidatus Binatia bacterium]
MRILGLDTSTSVASVAISEDGRIVAEDCYPRRGTAERSGAKSNHAEIILPLIDSVLHRAGIGLRDVTGIAVAIGPGSFTGVRIGLSTVQGLAYGTGVPAVGISTLQAIAARVADFEGIVCPILDARKDEVYAAIFRKQGNHLERLTEDALVPILSFLRELRGVGKTVRCLFIGEGVNAYGPLFQQAADLQISFAEEEAIPSVAASIALLSEGRFIHDRPVQLEDLAPVYLRRPECEFRMKATVSS